MKHIKLFETKFSSPGLRNKNIGRFLVGMFFKKSDVSEVTETENNNGYHVEIEFFNFDSLLFENLVNMKNVLIQDYNVDDVDISVRSRKYDEDTYLELIIKGEKNIQKLKEDAKLYKEAKKYNL